MSIFLSVSQKSNSSLKLNITHQHESNGMFSFQNRVPDIKILKFHRNQDNSVYLDKSNFQQKLIFQLWDYHWIHGIEMSMWVVSDPDFESRLACTQNEANTNLHFSQCLEKCDFFPNNFKHRQIICCWKVFFVAIMNLRSLPKIRLCFAHIYLQSIYYIKIRANALSIETKGTMLKKSLS